MKREGEGRESRYALLVLRLLPAAVLVGFVLALMSLNDPRHRR